MQGIPNPGSQNPGLPPLPQFRRLLPFVRPYARKLSLVFLLTVFSSLIGLVYPLGARFLIDNVLGARNLRLLVGVTFVLAGIVLLGFLLSALTRYLYTLVSARILMDMRLSLFRHLQNLSPRFFAKTKTGEILSRLSSDVSEIQSLATDGVFSLALSLLTLVGTVGIQLYLNWKLFLLCTFFLPLSGHLLVRFRQRIAGQARTVRERNAEVSSTLVESLQGMKWIRTVGAEGAEADKLKQKNEDYVAALLGYQVVSAYANALPMAFLSLSTLVLLLYGGNQVIAGRMSLGSLVAFAAYQARVLNPVQNIIGLYLSVQRARVSLNRVFEFFDLQPEVLEKENAFRLSPPGSEIQFCDVSFAYQSGEPVLRNINLRIPEGSRVAIVGPSGAGKSTLVDLLLRFYDPQQGRVLFAGHDLKDVQLSSLRESFAVISAEPFLFHASIEENLRYANPRASEEDVRAAVRMADLEEFIRSLPDGMAAMVGERGLKLSTGQRQRMAIARAVLRDARVWVFDEATGALDVLTESHIWAALEKCLAGRTTLTISHRLSSVRGASRIFVLDRGQIVQQGSHAGLVGEVGLYQRLYQAAGLPGLSGVEPRWT